MRSAPDFMSATFVWADRVGVMLASAALALAKLLICRLEALDLTGA